MNIPYDKFYAAELNNSVSVDVFSSATKSKTKTGSLAGGSYHSNADGSSIDGITFPVKVSGIDLSKYKKVTDEDSVSITVTKRGQTSTTTYTGKDALFENADYAYYVLSDAPSYYKEATVNADGSLSFGKTVGTATELSDVTPKFRTESRYGDYQLNLDGLENTIAVDQDQVYGVIISWISTDWRTRLVLEPIRSMVLLSARKKAMTMVCVMWKISGEEPNWHGLPDLQPPSMNARLLQSIINL